MKLAAKDARNLARLQEDDKQQEAWSKGCTCGKELAKPDGLIEVQANKGQNEVTWWLNPDVFRTKKQRTAFVEGLSYELRSLGYSVNRPLFYHGLFVRVSW